MTSNTSSDREVKVEGMGSLYNAGDALLLPKDWLHCVRSEGETMALSLQVEVIVVIVVVVRRRGKWRRGKNGGWGSDNDDSDNGEEENSGGKRDDQPYHRRLRTKRLQRWGETQIRPSRPPQKRRSVLIYESTTTLKYQ